jgi:predicted MFS family arabinose efflux permease
MQEEPSAAGAGNNDLLRSQQARLSPTYVLVILTLVYVVNYLDRQIIGILSVPIKAEFHLTNLELGLLNGPAFALVYATLGIPIAVFADRVNRRNIIAVSLAMFSVMTVLCGYTVHFWQLLLARFGTGIGEAGTGPSINAIIADLYPPQKRASALAFYAAGLNVGLLFAFFGGGWIAQHYGWRHAFLAAGIPGLVLVLLLLFTVKEPPRGYVERLANSGETPSLWDVARYLWRQRSFRWFSVGTAMSSFGGYAGIAFIPLFLSTSHHMTLPEIGLALSVLIGIFGAIGTYFGGFFADRYGKKDVRWNMYVPIIAAFITVPFVPVFYLSSSTSIALAAGVMPALTGAAYVGPAFAMTQALVPLRMRVRATAILLFVLSFVGYAPAALIVGWISDLLQPVLGSDALRYAMLTGIVTGLAGAFCYWQAARTLRQDIDSVAALP